MKTIFKKVWELVPGDRLILERNGIRSNELVLSAETCPRTTQVTVVTRIGGDNAEMDLEDMALVEVLDA